MILTRCFFLMWDLISYMPILLKWATRQSCPVLSLKFTTTSFLGLPLYSAQILWIFLHYFVAASSLASCLYFSAILRFKSFFSVSSCNSVSLLCNVIPLLASLSAISLQAIVFMKNCFLVLRRWDILQSGFLHVFIVSVSGKSIRITLKLFLKLVVMPMNFEFHWCGWVISFSGCSQVAVLCDGVAVLLHTWSSFSSGVLETIWKVF